MVTGKAAGAWTDALSSTDASFTKRPCADDRIWAVDATREEELPVGWQALARDLFNRIASVMAIRPAGMLVVRGLGEEGGGLAADVSPIGDTPDAVRAFRTVQGLVEQARRASEGICSVCGELGSIRSKAERYATRCDAHAGEFATRRDVQADLGPKAGEGQRPPVVAGREDARGPTKTRAPDVDAGEHRLYHLCDVEAALGRRRADRGTSMPGAAFVGDPDDAGSPEVDTVQQEYLRALLADGEAACRRMLAHPEPASLAALDDLQARAPHMAGVTAVVRRHLQAAIAMGLPTSLPALMLIGEPGTGKTWFLSRLAALLGLPHRRYNMSGQSLADGLMGAYPTWRNAQPGLVAKCLLTERVANPLVLVDEVDKAGNHQTKDPYRPFYDLLEPEGARGFTDEYLGFPMDASNVLWVLAGNDLAPLPAPIVDRLTVIEVPTLDEAHLRAVAASVYEECNEARRSFFAPSMDATVLDRLLGTNPRGNRKAIAEAMTLAAADGRRTLHADDLAVAEPPRRTIGFR